MHSRALKRRKISSIEKRTFGNINLGIVTVNIEISALQYHLQTFALWCISNRLSQLITSFFIETLLAEQFIIYDSTETENSSWIIKQSIANSLLISWSDILSIAARNISFFLFITTIHIHLQCFRSHI